MFLANLIREPIIDLESNTWVDGPSFVLRTHVYKQQYFVEVVMYSIVNLLGKSLSSTALTLTSSIAECVPVGGSVTVSVRKLGKA